MRIYKEEKFKTENYKSIDKQTLLDLWKLTFTLNKDKEKFYVFVDSVKNFDNLLEIFEKFLSFKASPTDGMYNIDYISLKFNVSKERAQEIVDHKKSSKATSLSAFISRHGEELGREKFKKFQETSIAPHLWLNEVSEDEQLAYHRTKSRRCWEYYVKIGIAENQAEGELFASEYQRNTAGVLLDVYRNRGMSDEQVREIESIINAKKGLTLEQLKERYPNDWFERHQKRIDKFRKTIGATPPELFNERDSYYAEVAKLTEISWLAFRGHIENVDRYERCYAFHLDHKISKLYGFMNDIPPEIIGHPMNLALIPASVNMSKQDKCSQTLEILIEKIKEFENASSKKDC